MNPPKRYGQAAMKNFTFLCVSYLLNLSLATKVSSFVIPQPRHLIYSS